MVRLWFGSTSFFKKWFEFGSVRHNISRNGSSSIRSDIIFQETVRVRFVFGLWCIISNACSNQRVLSSLENYEWMHDEQQVIRMETENKNILFI